MFTIKFEPSEAERPGRSIGLKLYLAKTTLTKGHPDQDWFGPNQVVDQVRFGRSPRWLFSQGRDFGLNIVAQCLLVWNTRVLL